MGIFNTKVDKELLLMKKNVLDKLQLELSFLPKDRNYNWNVSMIHNLLGKARSISSEDDYKNCLIEIRKYINIRREKEFVIAKPLFLDKLNEEKHLFSTSDYGIDITWCLERIDNLINRANLATNMDELYVVNIDNKRLYDDAIKYIVSSIKNKLLSSLNRLIDNMGSDSEKAVIFDLNNIKNKISELINRVEACSSIQEVNAISSEVSSFERDLINHFQEVTDRFIGDLDNTFDFDREKFLNKRSLLESRLNVLKLNIDMDNSIQTNMFNELVNDLDNSNSLDELNHLEEKIDRVQKQSDYSSDNLVIEFLEVLNEIEKEEKEDKRKSFR